MYEWKTIYSVFDKEMNLLNLYVSWVFSNVKFKEINCHAENATKSGQNLDRMSEN